MKFLTVKKPIHVLHHLLAVLPQYEHQSLAVHISLDMANCNMVNMSSFDFCIWQNLEKHQNETQLHHLTSIPSVPVNQLYKHVIDGIHSITPFTSPEESTGETVSIWMLFSHTGVYVMPIILLILTGLGIFCCYLFWCQPARLMH